MSALYAACRMYCCCSGSHAFGHVVPQFFAMLPKPARGHSRLTVGAQKLDADEEEVDLSALDDNQKMATIKALRHKPWLFLHNFPFTAPKGTKHGSSTMYIGVRGGAERWLVYTSMSDCAFLVREPLALGSTFQAESVCTSSTSLS